MNNSQIIRDLDSWARQDLAAFIHRTFYLMDVLRLKLNYPDLKKAVIRHAFHHRADTRLIEDKDSGTALIQELQNAYAVRRR